VAPAPRRPSALGLQLGQRRRRLFGLAGLARAQPLEHHAGFEVLRVEKTRLFQAFLCFELVAGVEGHSGGRDAARRPPQTHPLLELGT
jgi:hypothetical protein